MEFQVGHLIHISRHHVLHTQRRVFGLPQARLWRRFYGIRGLHALAQRQLHGLAMWQCAVWQCDLTFLNRHAQGRVLQHAVAQSRAESDELLIQADGVWTDQAHGSMLVAIAYGDSVFTPSA